MRNGYVDVFATFGAKLRNPQWSFSAQCPDGSIVLSCWTDFFVSKREHGLDNVMRYRDTLNRVAHNPMGAKELEGYLKIAKAESRLFHLVVARPGDSGALTTGRSASNTGNRFHAKPQVAGSLVSFDGDAYVIDFRSRV